MAGGLPYLTAERLKEIAARHDREYGKIFQKLLARTFVELGYRLAEERAVQGVDIDVVHPETGEKLSFEVKTSVGDQVEIAEKDVQGLASRRDNDDYRPYFAFLFLPWALSEGWIIVPAGKAGKGRHAALRLASLDEGSLSRRVNEAFPGVLDGVADPLLSCPRGQGLAMIKKTYEI